MRIGRQAEIGLVTSEKKTGDLLLTHQWASITLFLSRASGGPTGTCICLDTVNHELKATSSRAAESAEFVLTICLSQARGS